MKKINLLFLFAITCVHINAQSVSIGTIASRGKLTILDSTSQYTYTNFLGNGQAMGPFVRSTLGFGGTNYASGAISTIGIDASSARMAFYTGYTTGDILNSPERITIANTGAVGINNSNPQANLDLAGNMKVSSFNSIEFGAGVAGKEPNAGKIGYRTFTADALDIVGAGSNTFDRKVKIYAEAGTTLTGPVNIAGALQVFGNSGTAGQVLTSNGASGPSWQNAAYSNSTRFAVSFTKSASAANDYAVINATRYNLNTTDVSINSTGITINRSGLYHFDLMVDAGMSFASAQSFYPLFDCWLFTGAPNAFEFLRNRICSPTGTANTQWRVNDKASLEVQVTAPATLRIYHSFGSGGGTSFSVDGYLTGNLISD